MTATVGASYFCFSSIIVAASIVGRVLEVFCKRMMNFSLKSQGHKAVRQRLRYAHRNGPGAGLRAEAACVGTPGWLGPGLALRETCAAHIDPPKVWLTSP